jgi:hypothetical protein
MDTPSAFNIGFDPDRKVVRVQVLCDINKAIGETIVTQARTLALQHNCPLLYRDIRLDASFADMFYLPRKLKVLKDPKTRRLQVALLISEPDQKNYLFYETVMHNMGLSVRVFLDEKEALAWLNEA